MKPARIPLGGKHGAGKYLIVDSEDVEKVAAYKWHVSDNGYVVNRTNGKTIRVHRLIMSTPEGMDTDHLNHDKLDNRKSNLKICTRSQNLLNKRNVKGYYFSSKRNRYIVDYPPIGVNWKQFKTEQEAKDFIETKKAI